ncbi:hypothetical protein K469DRAFT_712347 [Zopfia rhizophila CBS 207.26]|uniref:Uncharacterized protein n=1 Tax=Zopfia rhizophila CBS 207.26 TaxID=1314779 RepID=A0A6A6EU04_9PEZI|nr:hypothetical protein K469DRAFT_712347 [Zopfia rhizophila CBS 207.26]
MATRLSADEAASKPMPDERTTIVSSAKMHMSIFRAQLLFLHETGSVPKEIEDILSDLMANFLHRSTAVTQAQMKPPTPIHETLNTPLTVSVKDGYLCENYRHVVANSGDQVVVFAWTKNHTEAIAYNPRNKTAGRIPADLLEKGDSKPFTNTKLCMTTSDERPNPLGLVKWKAGDYVRVWNREDKSHARSNGFCFNLATGEIGKFDTMSFFLQVID